MLVYNIFIFIVAALLYIDYATNLKLKYKASKANVKYFSIYFVFGVIIMFAGFRYEIGYDYPKYLAGFLFDSELKKWEPLFNASVHMLREINFGLDSQMLFLFYSTVTIAILYNAIKRLTPHYRLAILLYLLIPALYLNTFSILRQGIAMVILLYGLRYITVEVNIKKYLLTGLIAFMFHYSSIFVVLIYLLFGRLFNKTYSWITYFTLILISFFLSFVHLGKYILLAMPGKFGLYANYEIDVSILKLLVVNVFFIFLMLQKKQYVKTRLGRYMLNSMFLASIIFNIFADFVYVTRMAQYFLMVEIILVPMYIYSFKSEIKQKVILGLFLTYYLFNFDYALYRDLHYPGSRPHFLIPYDNYFIAERKSDKEKYQQQWIEFYKQIGLIK